MTKENFFNDLGAKFPEAMKLFKTWIDQYKQDNNWQDLFNGWESFEAPKYHDLPLAMQAGIFIQFAQETEWTGSKYEHTMELDREFWWFFARLESHLLITQKNHQNAGQC